jgi:peroxin-14
MREDLVNSAVNFLRDAKVQSASMAKKVSFLESKGMTSDEIQEALRRTSTSDSGSTTVAPAKPTMPINDSNMAMLPAGYSPVMMQAPPPPLALNWKDYFIAAVVIGGVGYGAAMLARVYYYIEI